MPYGAAALLAWYGTTRLAARWLTVSAMVLLPAAVAAARLYRGGHHPTDIAGSVLLAVLWLACTRRIVKPVTVRTGRSETLHD
ncbi:phosphatase PAP2 family protein [Dactylosporangium sp. NBC_01737]|uniref:phosphatase PAP2 family protein n=1 Tax=Dactylosporangium sp. NBC_01737 TaxID=2975959 RepID=UPI002E15DE72|nr:phosphatase PAP2 family protein [Dactylosporangium sp. NBC_01737]